jgi:hypothetical protein
MAKKLRQQIIDAKDTRAKTVTSSHWKDAEGNALVVEVRSLSLTAHAAIVKDSKDESGEIDTQEMSLRMLMACVYDPADGALVFEEADREVLGTKNSAAVAELMAVVQELNGLTDAAAEQAEKN